MLKLPVPAGTVKLTALPTAMTPGAAAAGSTGEPTGAACAGSHAVVGCGLVSAGPTRTVGVPGGVPAGARHAPFTHELSGAVHPPAHSGKQNEPVDVLTHLPFAGQVVWSFGLHAAVQAPPGNSGLGSPAQISPGRQPAPQARPRSALAGRL